MMTRFRALPALRRILASAALALLGTAPLHAQGAALPDTPAGRRAAALLAELRNVSEERVRAFVGEQMSGQFQQIPLERHLAQFRRMSGDFANAPLQSVRSESPTRLLLTVQGGGGPLTMTLDVEAAPPHRIVGLRVQPGGGGGGEDEPAPAAPLTDAARAAVADSAAALLARNYVSRDTAERIGARLRERARAGAYAGMDRAALAQALTEDIRAVHPDRHLRVVVGAGGIGPARPAPRADSAGGFRYITDARVLPGNVGYLRMSSFPGAPEAMDEMAAALRTLERTDAMIIDLRASRGGSAELANFLISHFTAPNLLSLAVFDPAAGDTTLRRTLADVPGPRRLDVPLFVLIDNGAGSAAEDVPFVLHNLGRATLVGERTAGAGRNNRMFPLGQGMSISISVTHVWDPCTGAAWERTGVTPDIAVPPADALEAALRAARDPARRPAAALPQAQCRRG